MDKVQDFDSYILRLFCTSYVEHSGYAVRKMVCY
jgi:hypothetical protein